MQKNWQNKVIALSGSIGSGKSTALKFFSDLGAFTISADQLAKEVTKKEASGYSKVVEAFGKKILDSSEEVDRKKLAKIIFADPNKRQQLEEILHPLIQQEAKSRFEKASADNLLIYEIPLLFETGQEKNFLKSVLVYAPEEVCIERVMERNGMSKDEVKKIMQNQLSIEEKRKRADYVIENVGSVEELRRNVEEFFSLM